MLENKGFSSGKKNALDSLEIAYKQNKVDIGIKKILKIINNCHNYYTSSSCAGRIVLLEIPEIGDKKNAKFLEKWHRQIKKDEIENAAKKADNGLIWLLAQSPIIHVISKTFITADSLIKIAISCGFKNSGLKSIIGKNIVEICSTERLDAPIGKDGSLFCNTEYLNLLVEIVNNIILKSNKKIHRLEIELKKICNHKNLC
jgi:tRNA wybutosine-synthesizing protein 3